MDRSEGKPLENVIFAVQDINDEKTETQLLAERLEEAEAATTANNAFLSMAYENLQAPVREILEINGNILRESDEEKTRDYAESIRSTADRMLTLISGLAHRAEAIALKGKTVSNRYSLRQTAEEALRIVQPAAKKKHIGLETEIAENLPDMLIGDAEKLKEITVSLLANAVNHSKDGSIRLSVFGKVLGENVHLLVSVRALPENEIPSGELPDPKAVRVENDLDLEVAGALLASLHSELKSVLSADAWKDIYFEIDQRIAEENSK
jgi:signal transduction histidine kinase